MISKIPAHMLLFFSIAAFMPVPAWAQGRTPLAGCDCPVVRLDDAYCVASLVFEGVPVFSDTAMTESTGTRYPKNPIAHVDVLFKVDRTLKGTANDSAVISSPFTANACTFRFTLGTHYLVFARMEEGLMVTDRCTPTRTMDAIGARFRDSLEFVRSGQRWVGGGGSPLDIPCK